LEALVFHGIRIGFVGFRWIRILVFSLGFGLLVFVGLGFGFFL